MSDHLDARDDDIERSDVMFYIEQIAEDEMEEMPFMPRDLDERAVDVVLRRIRETNTKDA